MYTSVALFTCNTVKPAALAEAARKHFLSNGVSIVIEDGPTKLLKLPVLDPIYAYIDVGEPVRYDDVLAELVSDGWPKDVVTYGLDYALALGWFSRKSGSRNPPLEPQPSVFGAERVDPPSRTTVSLAMRDAVENLPPPGTVYDDPIRFFDALFPRTTRTTKLKRQSRAAVFAELAARDLVSFNLQDGAFSIVVEPTDLPSGLDGIAPSVVQVDALRLLSAMRPGHLYTYSSLAPLASRMVAPSYIQSVMQALPMVDVFEIGKNKFYSVSKRPAQYIHFNHFSREVPALSIIRDFDVAALRTIQTLGVLEAVTADDLADMYGPNLWTAEFSDPATTLDSLLAAGIAHVPSGGSAYGLTYRGHKLDAILGTVLPPPTRENLEGLLSLSRPSAALPRRRA